MSAEQKKHPKHPKHPVPFEPVEPFDMPMGPIRETFREPSGETFREPSGETFREPRSKASAVKMPSWASASSVETWGGGSSVRNHEANVREVKEANASGKRHDIVFYGDSITSIMREMRENRSDVVTPFFENNRLAFLGCPGNDVEDLTWRILSGKERLGVDPKVVVLWIGTNNLGRGTSPVDKLDFLLKWFKKNTESRVVYLNMLPCAKYKTAAANLKIKALCKEHGAPFAACGADLNPADASVMPDGLHPSPKGYTSVMKCLAPLLLGMLKTSPPSSKSPPSSSPQNPQNKNVVGLFVHTWHDGNPPGARHVQTGSSYTSGWYWWGRPAFGDGDLARYRWSDQKMVDYHIDNFEDLGVDFLFLDFTNGNQPEIKEGAHSLCRRLVERKSRVKVAFWIQKPEYAPMYQKEFYSKYADAMFEWKGKPLLLLQGVDDGWRPEAGKVKPPPSGKGLGAFTARWCWGLLGAGSGTMWTFKESKPPKPYVHDGKNEQIGMAFATQATYMTTPEGRKCRDGGKFFESQVANVRKHKPQIVTLCGYNEWMAINMGTSAKSPRFVDLWGAECSHDIEPMKGGHGDTYFKQAKKFIRSFKK
jgi:lysophospholipase L1-like esterase